MWKGENITMMATMIRNLQSKLTDKVFKQSDIKPAQLNDRCVVLLLPSPKIDNFYGPSMEFEEMFIERQVVYAIQYLMEKKQTNLVGLFLGGTALFQVFAIINPA